MTIDERNRQPRRQSIAELFDNTSKCELRHYRARPFLAASARRDYRPRAG